MPDNRTINRHLRTIGQAVGLTEKVHLHVTSHTLPHYYYKLQFVGPYVTRAFQHARPDVGNAG